MWNQRKDGLYYYGAKQPDAIEKILLKTHAELTHLKVKTKLDLKHIYEKEVSDRFA